MTTDPSKIGSVTAVRGDSVTAVFVEHSSTGLTFARGDAYQVGRAGTFVRVPQGLVDLFAVVTQVGSSPAAATGTADEPPSSRPWMELEVLGEAHRDGRFERGTGRSASVGDDVMLVSPADLARVYQTTGNPAEIRVGQVSSAPALDAMIDLGKLISRHGAVVGSTGSGKSSAVSSILRSFTTERFPSSRAIVLDVHGEYARALPDDSVSLRVVGARRGDNIDDGLYLPYWALPFNDFVNLAFGVIDENSAAILQNDIVSAKQQYAKAHKELGLEADSVTADTPLPFSIRSLWYRFHELHYATHSEAANAQTAATKAYAEDEDGNTLVGNAERVQPPSYKPATSGGNPRIYLSGSGMNMRRQTDALAARLRDPRFDFLFRPGPWTVDEYGETDKTLGDFLELWLGNQKRVVVADLSGIPNEILQGVVSVLLKLLYEALLWSRQLSEGARERPVMFVLEEAHRYLSDSRDAAGEIVERIVKEGRKYGVGLLIVSQRPSEIRATVLSQVGTFFVLRLSNSNDRGVVVATLPDNLAGLFAAVPVLRTGEAIITGDSVKLPMRVQFDYSIALSPDSADPLITSRERSGGWDVLRIPQDYEDVASTWLRLTPISSRTVVESSDGSSTSTKQSD